MIQDDGEGSRESSAAEDGVTAIAPVEPTRFWQETGGGAVSVGGGTAFLTATATRLDPLVAGLQRAEEPAALIVDQFGAYVGRSSERVRVSVKGTVVAERPLHDLDQVLVTSGGVSVSSDLIRACAENGIQISFLTSSGAPYARLAGPGLTGTIRTRREQLLAYLDGRGVAVAQAFTIGKLLNQANLLRYMTKNRPPEDADAERARETALWLQEQARRITELAGATVDALRQDLLVLEAHGAKAYWEAARGLIVPETGWQGRETRGAQDLVNSCLNYGYGVLYSQVERAIVLAGLDPYAGFIHADRAGKPSLVLDAVEEFRQPVVDRSVFGLLNRGSKLAVEDGRLTDETRRLLAARVLARLEGEEPYGGKRQRLGAIVQTQARRLAAFLRGDGRPYTPYIARW